MPSRGFTLVELMVVIAIIAILATVGFASYQKAQSTARDSKRVSDLQEISKAMEQYKALNNTYTPATTFPCTTFSSGPGNNTWTFNDSSWGNGAIKAGCPASLKSALASYFTSVIPDDPFCPSGACAGGWKDYALSESAGDGSSFVIYAELENKLSNNNCSSGVTPPPPYNYCLPSEQ